MSPLPRRRLGNLWWGGRNVNADGKKLDQNRVVLELRRVDGDWKVARATAI